MRPAVDMTTIEVKAASVLVAGRRQPVAQPGAARVRHTPGLVVERTPATPEPTPQPGALRAAVPPRGPARQAHIPRPEGPARSAARESPHARVAPRGSRPDPRTSAQS